MNLLISKLMHWFAFGGTTFFAAGAVVDAGAAPAGDSAVAPSSTPSSVTPSSETPAAPPSLSDIVSKAADNAEKALTKPAIESPTAVEPPKIEETKPAEVKVEETKPAEVKPVVEANPLDKIGALPAEKITAALAKATPEVQQFLKDNGLSVEALTENARMAAQTTQYQERFPTIEAADEALVGAQNFWKLDQGLPAVQSLGDFDKFMMETLVPMSFIRDEAGNPIPDPANPGAFKNDGSIGKLIDFSADVRDKNMMAVAELLEKNGKSEEEKQYGKDLTGALKWVGDFIKNGYKMPGVKEDITTLPDWAKKEVEDAKALKAEAEQTRTKNETQQYETRESKITDQTYQKLSPFITDFLKDTALSKELKDLVAEKAWNVLTERLQKEPVYGRLRDTMSPSAKDYEQRRVAHNETWMKPRLAKILDEVVGVVGGRIVDENKARLAKLDTAAAATRMEPKTTGTTVQAHPGISSPEDIGKKALELARQANPNAEPGSREYWDALTKLKKLPTAV